MEAGIRENQTKLEEITVQYNAQVKRLTNCEQADVDASTFKRQMDVLRDVISHMQADRESRREKLRVLYTEASVLEAERAETKHPSLYPHGRMDGSHGGSWLQRHYG